MAYAITEYEFWGNPKVREAGKDAVLLYLAGNSYCNQFMTDGLITFASISTIANLAFQKNPDKAIKALIDNRLWLKAKTGYQVHDYLQHNKSKAQIEDLMKKRSSAGKASAKSRVSTDELTDEQANELTSVETSVEQVLKQMPPSISYSFSIPKDKELLPPQEVSQAGEIFKVYENEIGVITPSVADSIKSALEDYPVDWFKVAMKEAAINNKRNWRYVEAILKRWKVDGFMVDARQKQSYSKRSAPFNQGLEAVKAMAASEGITLDGIFEDFGK